MLRRRAVRSLVRHAARVQRGRWAAITTPRGTAECTRSHPSLVWRSPRLAPQHSVQSNAQTWRALRAALCGSRRYVTAAYVVAYYPPAPLVVATTASGARLTDMPESAMVRSLVRPRLGFGVGRKARYGTIHRCRHAVVSCMEEVAFLLHVRCTEHVACYMMHAACSMQHAVA